MQFHRFENSSALNSTFAKWLIRIVKDAIAERGHAYLAVSGGRTPQALFAHLAGTDLPWQQVTITLADDRWLAPDAQDSNERLVKSTLLQDKASAAHFISLVTTDERAEQGAAVINQRLSSLPKFDAVILGMGEDGHTASLFPCSQELSLGLSTTQDALAVHPTSAPYQRISLSKQRLLNTQHLFLHLVGAGKLPVLNQAVAGDDVLQMPIRAFLHHPCVDIQVMFATQ